MTQQPIELKNITVDANTYERLKRFGLWKGDSFADIINRLIDVNERLHSPIPKRIPTYND